MKPTTCIGLAALVAASATTAWSADAATNPVYTARTELSQRQFGDVRFVIGAGRATRWLEMYSGELLVAGLEDFEVDEVIASPDGKYFLALSNSSSSSMAFAVLDRKGHVVISNVHGGELNYCRRTNWGVGEWADIRSPQATFRVEQNQMTTPATEFLTVSVRGCDGGTVLLGRASESDGKEPADKATRKDDCSAPASGTSDRGISFIGRTICNMRSIDPDFGARTLTLTDP